MAQVRQVVSEALQATVRRLLPSQQGFTEDLQASNVITPIIDLTPSAEGSTIPRDAQIALSFGGITAFDVSNTTTTIINNAGFYQITGIYNLQGNVAAGTNGSLIMSDGTTDKTFALYTKFTASAFNEFMFNSFNFTVFLRAGDSVKVQSSDSTVRIVGESHQIADVNGNLVNPSGFTPS